MAGSHSSRMFTMVEVLDILDEDDNIGEPICDGSDDDFGMLEEGSGDSGNEPHHNR